MQTAQAQFTQAFQSKKILIFGLGLLGSASGDARVFAGLGCPVRATDLKTEAQLQPTLKKLKDLSISYTLGAHRAEDIEWADVIVRNPGVPLNHPLIQLAVKLGKAVVMDAALTAQYAGIPVVGVTGTRGKSTTTAMIAAILEASRQFKTVLVGGNLPGAASLPLLSQIEEPQQSILVMELSSWQLQGFNAAGISPHLAVVTNFYPDHLNYYANMSAYASDKQAIFRHQTGTDILVLNGLQPEFKSWAETAPGRVIWFYPQSLPADLSLEAFGAHNRANAAAAWVATDTLGVNPDLITSSLTGFKPLPYRLEPIRVYQGRTIINDTTSTTPIATQTALEALTSPITLICGGTDKKLPLNDLAGLINRLKVPLVLLPGTGTDRLRPLIKFGLIKAEGKDLGGALSASMALTPPGGTILFSPGFTSFSMFNNEFDRGDQFNQLTGALK